MPGTDPSRTDTESGADAADKGLRARMQAFGNREQRFEQQLATALGIDHPGLMVMNVLATEGRSTPTELARRLGISTAAMSLVLNRLEAVGHARRDRHPSDGRKLVVTAAEPSITAALRLVQPVISGIDAIAASMTESERRIVERFLDAVIAVYDEVTADPVHTASDR